METCAHGICTCNVAEHGSYCSNRCEEAHKRGEDACTCGHRECTASQPPPAP